MRFDPPLISASLIRRYKRFLADVRLGDGRALTVHCANPGRMDGCCEPNSPVLLSDSRNPQRKLRYTWELVHTGATWVGVNTMRTNGVVREAIEAGAVPELAGYPELRAEVKYGAHSRVDLLLSRGRARCYVEVKNVTLAEEPVGLWPDRLLDSRISARIAPRSSLPRRRSATNGSPSGLEPASPRDDRQSPTDSEAGCALFPDAVTQRGLTHLHELSHRAAAGDRAVMFYLVNREDCDRFAPATHIDPAYAAGLVEAVAAGVEVVVYAARVRPEGIEVARSIRKIRLR